MLVLAVRDCMDQRIRQRDARRHRPIPLRAFDWNFPIEQASQENAKDLHGFYSTLEFSI